MIIIREIIVEHFDSGGRLNKFLQKYLDKGSQSFIYKMLRKKNIVLNNSKATGSEILNSGDIIKLFLSEETISKFKTPKLETESIIKKIKNVDVLDIIYEDENILIVNKGKDKLSHPNNEKKESLIDDILYYLNNKNTVFKPALVNRLDRNTTGIVICGKNLKSVQSLNKAIHDKTLDKYYIAIVCGNLRQKGVLNNFYEKDTKNNKIKIFKNSEQFIINNENIGLKNSKSEIITEYEPLEVYKNFTLVRLKLITGKSHQLRAHMSSIGHPILGDFKYGDSYYNNFVKQKFNITSQLLHSNFVHFKNLTEPLKYINNKNFESEIPNDFKKIFKRGVCLI
ncbi:MAG: RluA family pseudouridine synthase [Defluviitaleaceae bacterium]|nr:RluA family pseudouridine synthase [Defluviitaleaceae bacterium]